MIQLMIIFVVDTLIRRRIINALSLAANIQVCLNRSIKSHI